MEPKWIDTLLALLGLPLVEFSDHGGRRSLHLDVKGRLYNLTTALEHASHGHIRPSQSL